MAAIEKRAEDLLKQIEVDLDKAKLIYDECALQIHKGLMMHKENAGKVNFSKCDLMMLDSGIHKTPTGSEEGVYYGIDMGGTNVRAVRVVFTRSTVSEIDEEHLSLRELPSDLPNGVCDKHATATQLFDGVALALRRLISRHGDGDAKSPQAHPPPQALVGFTCSFGIQQTGLDCAILSGWSKGIETGMAAPEDPVVGRDVVALLNSAFKRQSINARVNCVLNDTISTLMVGGLERPQNTAAPRVGVVVGTGFNVCYTEPDYKLFGYVGRVINTEAGGLVTQRPRCVADALLDFESSNPGRQMLEKMVSGLYVGEVIRLMLLQVLQSDAPPALWRRNAISAMDAAAIYNGDPQAIPRAWFGKNPSAQELAVITSIVHAVFTRSAALVAIVAACFATKAGCSDGVTIGVDGSMIIKNPKYRLCVFDNLTRILPPGTIVTLVRATGGSTSGAALLAACTN